MNRTGDIQQGHAKVFVALGFMLLILLFKCVNSRSICITQWIKAGD